jgi:hypothetical protein
MRTALNQAHTGPKQQVAMPRPWFTLRTCITIIVACSLISNPVFSASTTRFAILSSGDTTFDGQLTLRNIKRVDDNSILSIRNNDSHPVIVSTASRIALNTLNCTRRNLIIPPNSERYICTLGPPTFGTARRLPYSPGSFRPRSEEAPDITMPDNWVKLVVNWSTLAFRGNNRSFKHASYLHLSVYGG